MNYVDHIKAYSRTMHRNVPPIAVMHPSYGYLGACTPRKGLIPPKGRWASTHAILRDSERAEIQALRKLEYRAPNMVMTALKGTLKKEPLARAYVISKVQEFNNTFLGNERGAISNYDGIVAGRGSFVTGQDVWMALTATLGGVTLSWYDSWVMAWTPGSVPSVTAYSNAGSGGAVRDATSN